MTTSTTFSLISHPESGAADCANESLSTILLLLPTREWNARDHGKKTRMAVVLFPGRAQEPPESTGGPPRLLRKRFGTEKTFLWCRGSRFCSQENVFPLPRRFRVPTAFL